MYYPEYLHDLQRIHESEVYGMALFDRAAKLTRNSKHKHQWLVLKALEQQTLERYLAFMFETEQNIKSPVLWHHKGQIEGAVLAALPRRIAMKLLRDGTKPFQEKFLRLKNHADPAHTAFFAYVYAHEKAIESFANRELAGASDSLQAVESLLEQ